MRAALRPLWLGALLWASMPLAAQHTHHPQTEAKPAAAAKGGGDAGYTRFRREMDVGMERMMADMHAPGYVGDADIDFLAMMIPHHEGAVEMARLVLIHGRDPATRRLAADIIASQQVEIAGMKRRLAMLRSKEAAGEMSYPELGGARGPAGPAQR